MISIVVPVYNVEEFLDECIESIVNQSYSDLEIILVDDGSTDSSGRICDEWAEKDERVIVLHKKNAGVSESRNVGLKNASGQYVGFVDADDVLHLRAYEFLLGALIETKADVAICHEDAFEGEIYQEREYGEYKIECVEGVECLKKHFMDVWTGPINFVWNKLYKRELIIDLLFPVGRKMEDVWFSVEVLSRVRKAVWIQERLYGYRQRVGSIMNSGDATVFKQYCEAILHQREVLKDNEYDVYALKKIAHLSYEARTKESREGELAARNIFKSLYNESGVDGLAFKDKCNIMMARYFFEGYCLLHKFLEK